MVNIWIRDEIIILSITLIPDDILGSTKKYIEQYTEWTPNISVSYLNHSTALGAAILMLQQGIQKVISGSGHDDQNI